jgi:hypothetical protein
MAMLGVRVLEVLWHDGIDTTAVGIETLQLAHRARFHL